MPFFKIFEKLLRYFKPVSTFCRNCLYYRSDQVDNADCELCEISASNYKFNPDSIRTRGGHKV